MYSLCSDEWYWMEDKADKRGWNGLRTVFVMWHTHRNLTLLLSPNRLFHPNILRQRSCSKWFSTFVRKSDPFCVPGICEVRTILDCIRLRTKCHHMSMCLDRVWKTGLSDKATALVLSEYICRGTLKVIESSWNTCLSHVASWHATPKHSTRPLLLIAPQKLASSTSMQ